VNELEPRVIGAPAVTSATSQGRSRTRGGDLLRESGNGAGRGSLRDRAELSAAARASLAQAEQDDEPAEDAINLAHRVAEVAAANVDLAGAMHTAAVVRAARLIR